MPMKHQHSTAKYYWAEITLILKVYFDRDCGDPKEFVSF